MIRLTNELKEIRQGHHYAPTVQLDKWQHMHNIVTLSCIVECMYIIHVIIQTKWLKGTHSLPVMVKCAVDIVIWWVTYQNRITKCQMGLVYSQSQWTAPGKALSSLTLLLPIAPCILLNGQWYQTISSGSLRKSSLASQGGMGTVISLTMSKVPIKKW